MKNVLKLLCIGAVFLGSACSSDKGSSSNSAAPAATPAPAPPALSTAQPEETPAVPTPTPLIIVQAAPTAVPTPTPVPVAVAPTINSTFLEVLSVNGQVLDGSGAIEVTPGDQITLTADVFAASGSCDTLSCAQEEKLGIDQFSWSADDRESDLCNAADAAFCARSSSFAVSGNQVTFKVPAVMRGDITLTVRQNNTSTIGTLTLQANSASPGRGTVVVIPNGSGSGHDAGNGPGRGGQPGH